MCSTASTSILNELMGSLFTRLPSDKPWYAQKNKSKGILLVFVADSKIICQSNTSLEQNLNTAFKKIWTGNKELIFCKYILHIVMAKEKK